MGGVAKAFDVAPLADEAASELRVLHTGLRISGPRKPSDVARALAAHFDDFRACAQASVLPEPGRVQLELDVAQDGRASAMGLGQSALEQCLGQSLSGVTLAPGASGPAHIVCPLYFAPASSKLHSQKVAPAPAARCDCG